MAVEFLTDDWTEAVNQALDGSAEFKQAIANAAFSAQFMVSNVPGRGEVTYNLVIEEGGATMAMGPNESADVTVTQSYETAVKVSKGETSTQQAFMMGQIKVSGNMAVLMMNQAALTAFARAVAPLDIEYPAA